jgi:TRAP transporter TAXI family solute receptor
VTAGLTKVVQKYTGIRVSVEPTRGVRDWGPLMKKGEIQFANLSVTSVMFALLGKPPFKKDPYKFIRLVSNGHIGYQALYAKKGSGIKSVRDLKGKRGYMELKGHLWVKPWSELLLKGHGLEKKDMKWLAFGSPKEALKDVIEGRADSFVWALSPLYIELKSRVGGYPIPIEESAARYIEEHLPGMYMDTAPKGFMTLDSDYLCTSFPNSLWTSVDVPENVVYEVTKALYDHYDEYKAVHKNLQLWSLKNATKRIAAPLHPGAIKYYKEKGVWTPELEATQQKLLKRFGEVWGAPVSK